MIDAPLILNRDCYCRDVDRAVIIQKILSEQAAPNMDDMLATRLHYFARTSVFLSGTHLAAMLDQIRAIETVVQNPAYINHVAKRNSGIKEQVQSHGAKGVFMGYDFHITEDGPKLIEINSNAGGAFIVNMLEQSGQTSSGTFAPQVMDMFQAEWKTGGRSGKLRTLAIVDETPEDQYHYPDMCLAKSLLAAKGLQLVISDPRDFQIKDGKLYHGELPIDLVYNRLTDFDLSHPNNQIIRRAYQDKLAVVTPAPHHHALFADKRNLITLSDENLLTSFGVSAEQISHLNAIPKTIAVTQENAEELWALRRSLFFKPEAGFGSRGAFRGAKLTKKVWAEILDGGYIAQAQIKPPLRAVTVDGEKTSLKFDVRVYTYDGDPLLYAARIYQGQTTNLRTAGGGLAAVIPIPTQCLEKAQFADGLDARKRSA